MWNIINTTIKLQQCTLLHFNNQQLKYKTSNGFICIGNLDCIRYRIHSALFEESNPFSSKQRTLPLRIISKPGLCGEMSLRSETCLSRDEILNLCPVVSYGSWHYILRTTPAQPPLLNNIPPPSSSSSSSPREHLQPQQGSSRQEAR